MMTAKHLRALLRDHPRLTEALALLALEDNCLWHVRGPDGQETLSVGSSTAHAIGRAVEDPYTGAVKGDPAAYTATRVEGVTAGG